MLPILTIFVTILLNTSSGRTVKVANVVEANKLPGNGRKLPDGLLVARGEDLLTEVASWTVVVTLDVPPLPTELEHRLKAIEGALDHLNPQIHASEKEGWTARLQRIKMQLRPSFLHGGRHHRRVARGLFNFIGILSEHLFGTASEAEVRQTRQMIQKVNSNNQAVYHVVQELTTVVNQSRVYLQQNRDRINEVSKEVKTVEQLLNSMGVQYEGLRDHIETNYHRHQAERLVEGLEMLTGAYLDHVEHYHRQRTALEGGVLTEDLLTLEVLEDILIKARGGNRSAIKNVEWYYQYVPVQPLWGEDNLLVFKMELPLVKPITYLHYLFKAFPVPQAEGVTALFEVSPDVGYEPHTGGLFIPEICVGRNPIVCRIYPMRIGKGMNCERGLISQHAAKKQDCVLTMEKTVQVDKVWTTGLNQVVLSTWGGQLIERCTGRAEQFFNLEKGVYLFNLTENCIYVTSTWKVEYTPHYMHHVDIKQRPLPHLAPVNIPKFVATEGWKLRVGKNLAELGTVQKFKLSTLHEMEKVEIPAHKSNWFIGLVSCISVFSIVLIVIFYYKRRQIRKNMCPVKDVSSPSAGNMQDSFSSGAVTFSRLNRHEDSSLPSIAEREQNRRLHSSLN